MPRHLPRAGVGRIEVLVLVLLALLGLGLLLAFLPGQRERDKLATCLHHLRIQGEAIRNFSDMKGPRLEDRSLRNAPCLPPARLEAGYATWAVLITPYMNAKNPLAEWDERKTYFDQPESVRVAGLPTQFCPARARTFTASKSGDTKKGTMFPGALGDYAAAISDGLQEGAWDGPKATGAIIPARIDETKGDLILAWSGLVTRADLDKQRGLAYTLIVGEKQVPPESQGNADEGDGSVYNGAHAASFARVGGPEYPIAPSPAARLLRNFGSAHPGRCNFLFADGGTKTFSPSLDPTLLGRWIRRD